jgi:hypothetical protein
MANVTFQLQNGAGTFNCDIAGGATSGGNPAGTWTTDKTNQIVLTGTDGTMVTFPIFWQFNSQNQLRILDAAANELANFHAGDAVPLYSNNKDVLVVQPDDQNAFTFQLRGSWKLDGQHDLIFSAGGAVSTLDGCLQDRDGQFSYHFFDLANVASGNENILKFPGTWRDSIEDGKPMLDFDFEKEDGTTGTFDLPASMNLDPSINEIVYDYDKNGLGFRLQFVGELHVSSDFNITYKLDRQTSSTGASATTFSIDTVFAKQNFNGNLELAVKKDDGTPGTSLTIGGAFTAILGTSNLTVGFSYTQPARGNTQTFGFNGTFASQTGTDLKWDFTANSTQMSVDLSGDVVLGPVTAVAQTQITAANGQVVGIHALFGIQF